jgi:hypothetical protein
VWLNASLAQYAQQVSAGFPQIINTINGEVNDTGLVGGLAFSAYTCTTSPPSSLFFLVVRFFGPHSFRSLARRGHVRRRGRWS